MCYEGDKYTFFKALMTSSNKTLPQLELSREGLVKPSSVHTQPNLITRHAIDISQVSHVRNRTRNQSGVSARGQTQTWSHQSPHDT